MIANDRPNPFQVLGLPVRATEVDIAQRAQELGELAPTAEEGRLYRWAREQVITHPRTRLEYEVFEMPGALYDDPDWERFERKYARNPVDLRSAAAAVPAPTLEDFDLPALISIIFDAVVQVPRPDFTALVAWSPVGVGLAAPPLEVRDVIFG